MKLPIILGLISLCNSATNARFIGSPYYVAPVESQPPLDWIHAPSDHTLDWEIEVAPNKTIIARGTLEEVRAEALKHNPNWDTDYPPVSIDISDYDGGENHDVERALVSPSYYDRRDVQIKKREAKDFRATSILCGGRWKSVEWMEALHRIQYLYGVKGKPTNGPGYGACTRVSCAYNTAVVWCNDDPLTKSLNSFSQVADGAMAILGQCSTAKMGSERRVSGQAFHSNNWNVIVREEKC